MYDGGKVIIGLGIFAVVAALPIWFASAAGDPSHLPEPKLPDGVSRCVEDRDFMRASHMDLLDDWRDSVVRDGNREYQATDGQRWEMSLSRTCMSCHANESQFCGQCHDHLGVELTCWQCHVQPEGR